MVAIPRNASTVIVLKEADPEGFEVFLVKRNEKSAFMGSNFVYPGGTIDTHDGDPEILSYCKGISPDETERERLPFLIGAIRELFEEAGMLLAYDEHGNPFAIHEAETKERFNNYRDLLHKRQTTLAQIAKDERFFFALDQLHHFAHWITPEARPLRFNTHFFVARYPEGQKASADETETTDGTWMTPRRALEENLNGTLVLSPPTLKTLEDLLLFRTIGQVIASAHKSDKSPILSLLLNISSQEFLVFPWDQEYERFKTGDTCCPLEHGRPSILSDNSSRIIIKDGRNIPYCREV